MDIKYATKALTLFHLLLIAASFTEAAPKDGDVRLVSGDAHQGNVEVFYKGEWGAVCDDGWVLNNAMVVCRMLGYTRALGHTKQGYFGKVRHHTDFALDDVRCYGTEDTISDCEHRRWKEHNCDKREAAGVYCDKDSRLQEVVAPEVSSILIPASRDRTTNRPSTSRSTQASSTTRTTGSSTRTSTRQQTSTTTQTTRNTTPRTRPNRRPTTRPNRRPATRPATRPNRRPRPVENEIQNDVFVDPWTTTDAMFFPRRTTMRPTPTKRRNNRRKVPKKAKAVRRLRVKKPKKPTKPKKPKPTKPTKPTKKPHQHNKNYGPHNVPKYDMRLAGGRSHAEGRVEIRIDNGKWGVICSDHWSLREATVVCKHAGLNFASTATQGSGRDRYANYFGGENMNKVLAGVRCEGDENKLHQCYHEEISKTVTCHNKNNVAGVICTDVLPDLVPNATLLSHAYLEDRPLPYMECAMEEGCASSSAYHIKQHSRVWTRHSRRLLRFSSSTWNLGTADFRPFISKQDWEWHSCHMHYHSMEVFAHYDILDLNHNRVAEGHKASFCLEDVQCLAGHTRKYRCQGFGDQGISVGCADDYLHDIDCQWIDITDLDVGTYMFRVHINPEFKVAELNYKNNGATCDLTYTGNRVIITNCKLGNLPRHSSVTG